MFGYVRPLEPELKVREAAAYKAHYCALCKAIGEYGLAARNLLSYDCAFLALLLDARSGQRPFKREACIANPFVKKPVVECSESFRYAAAVNVLMAYGKLDDDWRDDKKLTALAAKKLLDSAKNKAVGRYPGLGQAIFSGLAELHALERDGCGLMDEAADAFARSLGLVFALPVSGRERAAMEWLGYNLGKWIYLIDAYDDLERDEKQGIYNVLLLQFGGADGARKAVERVRLNLSRSLAEARKALDLIGLQAQQGLLENILNLGCPAKMAQVLCPNATKEECINGPI